MALGTCYWLLHTFQVSCTYWFITWDTFQKTYIDISLTQGSKRTIISYMMHIQFCIQDNKRIFTDYLGIFRTILNDSILDSLSTNDMSSSFKPRRKCTSSRWSISMKSSSRLNTFENSCDTISLIPKTVLWFSFLVFFSVGTVLIVKHGQSQFT